ncbi:MAG: hypothetical protein L0387_39960 [Acidobacteria bacterium]|nr:hypothetical protein [Acidobacteriota bacterium]MCI0627763.1 hypothetical protein [Acidobacteriota bacterium]MCI0723541.1 hypothetical protein [Acidobacteriota bacterium]
MAEKVLLVCTSAPANVRRAVERFPNDAVFQHYELHLLCTAGDLSELANGLNVREFLVFPRRKEYVAAFRLWLRILRERYAVVVVLWCMEPGRALAKCFALACNGRRVLVFNENADCAFLSLPFLWSVLKARIQSGAFEGNRVARLLLGPLKQGTRELFRLALFPVRLVVLLVSVGLLYVGRDAGRRIR